MDFSVCVITLQRNRNEDEPSNFVLHKTKFHEYMLNFNKDIFTEVQSCKPGGGHYDYYYHLFTPF